MPRVRALPHTEADMRRHLTDMLIDLLIIAEAVAIVLLLT
jgi:hypothetical protein